MRIMRLTHPIHQADSRSFRINVFFFACVGLPSSNPLDISRV
jgi:hypothetical protein